MITLAEPAQTKQLLDEPKTSLLAIEGVTKRFIKGKMPVDILKGINLDIQSGEFVTLMGPSGSGKSTLLNIIGGLDKPSSGKLTFGGRDLASLSHSELAKWRRENLGFVFQNYQLIPVLSAAENVEMPLLLRKMSKQERQRRVNTALEIVGLSNRLDHYPKELSGGQEQRVSIARALVNDPTLLICDEPTGNLDSLSGKQILSILSSLHRDFGKTIIMVTHDKEAAKCGSRMVRLQDGMMLGESE